MKPGFRQIEDKARQSIVDYLKSDGPGGQEIMEAFMHQFKELGERSPFNDPTNILNHLDFVKNHIKQTWDESLFVDQEGNISIGVCTDDVLGFNIDREKLKHDPSPVVWTVFLIRGIGGRYAFVSTDLYFRKYGFPMPAEYAGGFLISKGEWENGGWDEVGPFELYEHPASGAPSIPFLRNVMNDVNMGSILRRALDSAGLEATYEVD